MISRLVPEVDASYSVPVSHSFDPQLGNWNENADEIRCDATGTYAFTFLRGPGRDDVIFDVEIEPTSRTETVGILIGPQGSDLETGYFLRIEPMKEQVVLDRWPTNMDPHWEGFVLNERHGIEVR